MQEQLAEGLCSPITISRIENERQMPSKTLLDALLARLHSNTYQLCNVYYQSEQDYDFVDKAKQANVLLHRGRFDEFRALFERLDVSSQNRPTLRQIYLPLDAAALLSENCGPNDAEMALTKLDQAVRLTQPNLDFGDLKHVLLSRDDNDLTSIETSYLEKIFDLVTYVLLFGGALAMLVVQDVRLAVVAVLLSIAPVCVSLLTGDRLASRQVMVSNESDSFVASIKDLVAGFSFIKSFMAEPAARRIFDESNRRLEDAKCAQRSTRESIAILSQLAYFVTQLGTALFAAWLCVEDGSVTPGTVMLVGQLMNYFSNPILQIPQVIGVRKSAHQLVGKLCELLATQDASDGTRELPTPLTKGISLSGVSFSYDCNRNMLDNISFNFHTGGCYAIVGGTGSGKSTLLSLLMGEHAGYTGEISYDRICVGDIRRTSLYRRVSIVRQENYLFNASLRDNITMFKEADEASLDRAVIA